MEKKIAVDAAKCIHCGMCIKDCLMGCLEFDGAKIPQYGEGGAARCTACQHCMAICPRGALSFGGKNPDDSEPVTYGNSEELLNLIKSRRSIRRYKQQDIPAEKISKLVEMLKYPPKGGNADSLHFSIVGTRAKMQEIAKLTYNKVMEMDSDSRLIQLAKASAADGNDSIYRNAPSMVAVSVNNEKVVAGCENADPIIALSYFELYAYSLGLGALWCDFAVTMINMIPEVQKMIGIPEGYTLNYTLLIGEPAVKYKRTVQPDKANVTII